MKKIRARFISTILSLCILAQWSCLGPSETASFENKNLGGVISASNVTRTWHSPQIIDIGAVDSTSASLNHDQNSDVSGMLYKFPMAIINNAIESFFVIFNRADDAPTGVVQNYYAYVTQPTVFDEDRWASSLSSFTRIDSNGTILSPGADAQRPLSVVDTFGNIYAMVLTPLTENATTHRRPLVTRRNVNSGAWSSPTRITKLTETGDILQSAAMGVDSYNNVTAVWVQNSKAYYNMYRPSLGWLWAAGSTSHTNWHDTTGGAAPLDLGMDIGFDSYGNGYATYITTTATFGAVEIVRWKGDQAAHFVTGDADTYQTLAAPGVLHDRYPRIWVRPDGAASVFFYRDYNGTTGAELWYAVAGDTSSSTSAAFSSASRFDTAGTGDVVMMDSGVVDVLQPIVRYKSDKAVVGYIKSDGTTDRLWISRYSSGTWSSHTAVDAGQGNVTWADLAINYNGDVVAVYSALGSDGFEHTYATNYTSTSGAFGSITQLDTLSSTESVSATTGMRPSVAMDSSGNAVATFTIPDKTSYFAPSRRRAVAVSFR